MCANRETSANRLRIGRRSALALVTIPIVGILWTMKTSANNEKVVKSDDEWMKTLGPERFKVMRKGGTEWSFTSDLNKEKRKGVYKCGACGNPLYDSETKYDSGTGWPSFWKPLDGGIAYNQSLMDKIVGQREVLCAKCNSHLVRIFINNVSCEWRIIGGFI